MAGSRRATGIAENSYETIATRVTTILVSESSAEFALRHQDLKSNGSTFMDDNYAQDDYVPYKNRFETYVVPVVFTTVFIFGVLGNGTVMYIFFRERSVRNSSNVHIFSLAIGDFLVMIGTVPFVSIIYIVDSWPFGTLICKLSEFLKDLSVAVTAFTLTALSIERYIVIGTDHRYQNPCGPFRSRLSLLSAIGIWLVAFGISVPGAWYSFVWSVKVTRNITIHVCYPFPEEMWPWYPRTIVLLKFLVLYAVPLCITTSLYALIAYNLITSYKLHTTMTADCSRRSAVRARWKAAKLVLLLIAIFAFCFFPGHLFLMWFYFHPNSSSAYNEFWHAFKIIGYVLTFVGSCLNPVALFFISAQFQKYIKKYLFCCCTKRS